MGRTGTANRGMYGQTGMGLNQNNLNQLQIATVRRIAFDVATRAESSGVNSEISQRLQKALRKGPLSPAASSTVDTALTGATPAMKLVTATFQGSVLVLQGEVATDHDRQLAEMLASMEPGVYQVQNNLVVTAAADSK